MFAIHCKTLRHPTWPLLAPCCALSTLNLLIFKESKENIPCPQNPHLFSEEQCRFGVIRGRSPHVEISLSPQTFWRLKNKIITEVKMYAWEKTRDPYLVFFRSLLLWTPRYTESSEGSWISPAQFSKQWAAVRNMSPPICKKKEKFLETFNLKSYPPGLLHIGCTRYLSSHL